MTAQYVGQGINKGLVFAIMFLVTMVGAGAYFGMSQGERDPKSTVVTDDASPAPQPAEPSPPKAAQEKYENLAPQFDEFRREPDGATVIAGRAEPGSTVSVMIDGKEVAKAETSATGSFALFTDISGATEAQVMTLETQLDGKRLISDDEIILAPMTTPAALVREVSKPVKPNTDAHSEEIVVDTSSASATGSKTAQQKITVTNSDDLQIAAMSKPAETPETAPGAKEPEGVQAKPTSQPADTELENSEVAATSTATDEPRIAVLRSNAEGVQVVNMTPPTAMTSVELDTIGYSARGEVQLSGRAQLQAKEVRVYLNNSAIVALPVDATGRWQGDLPNVDQGVYTLRVDEVRGDGKVTSRVETPFKRESANALEEAKLDKDGNIVAVTVQKGNTLWAIARERYGEGTLYLKVFEANKANIRDPDLIYPGQVFDLPK